MSLLAVEPDFLGQLPSLTELCIGGEEIDALMQSLTVTLPQVEAITLAFSALNTKQLRVLLTHFPQLHSLRLEDVDKFDALTFRSPVRSTLPELCLRSCHFPVAAVSLRLLQSFGLISLWLDHQEGDGAVDAALVRVSVHSAVDAHTHA